MAASVQVIFAGDTRNLDRAFGQVRGETSRTEGALGKFKKFAGPAMLAGAVAGVALFKDALGGLRAEAEATKGLSQTLQTMGRTKISTEEITKFASTLQANSDFVEEDIIKAAGVMATFGNIADRDLNKANQAAADLAARFGMDLSGATVMLGKALNDPVAGLTALSRAGVQFTDQQKEQIAKMVEAGDVAGAQGLILAELAKQTEGAAATQQDAFERLGDVIGESAETLLQKFLPAIEGAVGAVTRAVEAFDRVPDSTKAVIAGIIGITGALWLLFAHPIVIGLTAIVGALIYLENRFGFVTKAIGVVLGAFQGLMSGALTATGAIVGAAARAAEALGFPGQAQKLRNVEAMLYGFRDKANAALNGIRDRVVNVTIRENLVAQRFLGGGSFGFGGKRHSGGITPGPPTSEMLMLLRGGERVLPSTTMGHGTGHAEDGSRVSPSFYSRQGQEVGEAYAAGLRRAGGAVEDAFNRYAEFARRTGDYLNDWITHLPKRMREGAEEAARAINDNMPQVYVDAQGKHWPRPSKREYAESFARNDREDPNRGQPGYVQVEDGTWVHPSFFNRRKYHSGGIVPGPPTNESLALLRGGERVSPSSTSGAGSQVIVLQVDGREMARVVAGHNDRAGRYGAVAR